MRVSSKGQVTIPVDIRTRFGFLPDTEVQFVVDDDTVKLVRATQVGNTRRPRGSPPPRSCGLSPDDR